MIILKSLTQTYKNIGSIFSIPKLPRRENLGERSQKDIFDDKNAKMVLHTVSKFYSISIENIEGQNRLQSIVKSRHVAMYLMREFCKFSYPNIARRLGNRDHTTIMHGHRKIEKEIKEDRKLSKEVALITKRLNFK